LGQAAGLGVLGRHRRGSSWYAPCVQTHGAMGLARNPLGFREFREILALLGARSESAAPPALRALSCAGPRSLATTRYLRGPRAAPLALGATRRGGATRGATAAQEAA